MYQPESNSDHLDHYGKLLDWQIFLVLLINCCHEEASMQLVKPVKFTNIANYI